MRIIISPAKKMRVDTDSFACGELPVFLDRYFDESRSTDTEYVFIRTEVPGRPRR